MEFKIFNTEEGEREVGEFESLETHEDMFNAAERDFWAMFKIVNWVEELEEETVKIAINVLDENGFEGEANYLRLWLIGKPE